MSTSLSDRVLDYQRTGQGLEGLIEDLAVRAYRYAMSAPWGVEDDAGELVAHLIPRLPAMLARFRRQGVPFEHYFNSVLRWNLKAERRRRRAGNRCWRSAALPDLWHQTGADPPEPADGTPTPLALVADRRRLLLGALRSAWRLGAEVERGYWP